MNTNTHTPRTPSSVRRAAPALAIVAAAIGLSACQTPSQAEVAPKPTVVQQAQVPAGVDRSRPADRVAEQLDRMSDRTAELIEQYRGQPVDRLVEQLEREAPDAQASTDRFDGMPADRVAETLEREAARTAENR